MAWNSFPGGKKSGFMRIAEENQPSRLEDLFSSRVGKGRGGRRGRGERNRSPQQDLDFHGEG